MVNKHIKMWKERILEVKEMGNCKNKIGQNYFSDKHDTDRMIFFCETQIDKLKLEKDGKEILQNS